MHISSEWKWNGGLDMLVYGVIVVQVFDCFDCLQILLRSLRRGGFHLLKTPVGWSTSGM